METSCGRESFRSLDFIYMPSRNVEDDFARYIEKLGAEPVFSIRAFGTRVAAVKLGEGPLLLLAGHLEGNNPILIYRVNDFEKSVKDLKRQGLKGDKLEIPHGPCFSFKAEGGQRFAIYELVRPDANTYFSGRFDP